MDSPEPAAHTRTRKGAWPLRLLLFLLPLVYFTFHLLYLGHIMHSSPARRAPDGSVLADLGGMRAHIPAYFSEMAEFDGDPEWGKSRPLWPQKESGMPRLRSFSFKVRIPDMRGLENPQLREEMSKDHPAATPWISVSVLSGEHFSGNGFLDRMFYQTVTSSYDSPLPSAHYETKPVIEFKLERYSPVDLDEMNRPAYRFDRMKKDVYIKRAANQKITSFISCASLETRTAACHHHFSLEPEAKVEVEIAYHRRMLSNWAEIEDKVRQKILGFGVKR